MKLSRLTTPSAFCGLLIALTSPVQAEEPATIFETKIISQQPEYYHGWPTVTRRANGELWVVTSGGREGHICPFGQVVGMSSRDNGETWSWPRVLLDTATDDRDAGVLETAKGTLLVTTFTSLAYVPYLKNKKSFDAYKPSGWTTKEMTPEEIAQWHGVHHRLENDQARQAALGEWIIRSTDGGTTWSEPLPSMVNSPHGPIQLADGRLLYAGKQLWTKDRKIGVCQSQDDGLTWQWLADIPAREGDNATTGYHELHAVEAANGTIVAQIRNHNKDHAGWTLQTVSGDGGNTWSTPEPVCYGLPSHLIRLRDNRLLMTYGHRRPPYGNQARISHDHGKTWSDPITLSSDGIGGDLGYPSTVELEDGTLLTVWYESMSEPKLSALRQTKWQLK